MAFRNCVKSVLLSVIVMHSIYLFLWTFLAKHTYNEQINLHENKFNGKRIYTNAISDNLMKEKLYMSVTKGVYMSVTTEVKTEQKPVSHITLNPEVNKLLNITFSRLKPPSLEGMNFLLENKSICELKNLSLIIMVHSAPTHFDQRQALRDTWAKSSRYSPVAEIRTIFTLGRLINSTLQALIEKEYMQYGDILQGNFVDGYKNLSLNTLYGFKWIHENCANAKFVIKVDDDIVINMNKLLHALNSKLMFMEGTREVACYRVRGSVHKDKNSKYFVGEHVFMKTNLTLPFCEGKFVLLTTDLIPDLIKASSITPLLWIEDIYWYGLVMSNIRDIKYTRLNWGDKIEDNEDFAIECLNKSSDCKFFITWALSVAEMMYIFNLMQSNDRYIYTATDFINATSYQDIVLVS